MPEISPEVPEGTTVPPAADKPAGARARGLRSQPTGPMPYYDKDGDLVLGAFAAMGVSDELLRGDLPGRPSGRTGPAWPAIRAPLSPRAEASAEGGAEASAAGAREDAVAPEAVPEPAAEVVRGSSAELDAEQGAAVEATEAERAGGDANDTEFAARALRRMIADLDEKAAAFRELPTEQRGERLADLDSWLEQAERANDSYARCEGHDPELRKQGLDAYFRLEHLVRVERKGTLAPERAAAPAAAKAAAPKPAKDAATTQLRGEGRRTLPWRGIVLGLTALLLGGWRVWSLVTAQRPSTAQRTVPVDRGPIKGADTNAKAAGVAEAFNAGVPVVTHVRLYQDKTGNLQANAHALDTGRRPPRLSYRWLKGNVLLQEGEESVVEASKVEAGVAYRVVVLALDGQHTSEPVEAGPIVAKAVPGAGAR